MEAFKKCHICHVLTHSNFREGVKQMSHCYKVFMSMKYIEALLLVSTVGHYQTIKLTKTKVNIYCSLKNGFRAGWRERGFW